MRSAICNREWLPKLIAEGQSAPAVSTLELSDKEMKAYYHVKSLHEEQAPGQPRGTTFFDDEHSPAAIQSCVSHQALPTWHVSNRNMGQTMYTKLRGQQNFRQRKMSMLGIERTETQQLLLNTLKQQHQTQLEEIIASLQTIAETADRLSLRISSANLR